jgi:N-acyl-D-aspartate/D-glutamate deacylase
MSAPTLFESARMMRVVSEAHTPDQKMDVYRSDEFRARFQGFFDSGRSAVFDRCWDRTVVSWFPPDRSYEERTLAAVAEEHGVHPALLVLDLAVESGLDARFRMAVVNWDEDEVEELLTDEHTMLGLSDAGAHASQLCDSGFATHLLGHWVRDKRVFSIEEGVRKLTREPAERFGLRDRGTLAVGRPADVVVFDPEAVACGPLRRVADQPGGAQRLVADAYGIDAVIVNGTLIRHHGVDQTTLPGRLLRGGSA